MNITIIGNGNIGGALAIRFSQKHNIKIYTRSLVKQNTYINMQLVQNNHILYPNNIILTDNLQDAVCNSDWIFITIPSEGFADLSQKLTPLLQNGQHIVGVPGSEGFELYFNNTIQRGCTVTGIERCHAIVRRQGNIIYEHGERALLRCASFPQHFNQTAVSVLEHLYNIKTEGVEDYLYITLNNSNPILHPARIFAVLREHTMVNPTLKFYQEWDNQSSNLLIQLDNELHLITQQLGVNVPTTLQHYSVSSCEALTDKIRGLQPLSNIVFPNINGVPDFSSRYFISDFNYGLDLLIAFAQLLNINVPCMIIISNWYHDLTNTERTINLSQFGIHTVQDITRFYKEN